MKQETECNLIWFLGLVFIFLFLCVYLWSCRQYDKDLEKDFKNETGYTWKEFESK